jgi:L-aspartate semialdehyde sulfurtransferase ferredoxin
MIKTADKARFHIEIDYRKCGNCGACVAVCPTSTLHLDQIRLLSADENCTGCKFCIITCPAGALVLDDEKIV